jgi:hypothetical protein
MNRAKTQIDGPLQLFIERGIWLLTGRVTWLLSQRSRIGKQYGTNQVSGDVPRTRRSEKRRLGPLLLSRLTLPVCRPRNAPIKGFFPSQNDHNLPAVNLAGDTMENFLATG